MIDLDLLTNVPSVMPDTLLFQMRYAHGGMMYKPSDVWCYQKWHIYGDGTVRSYMRYAVSGDSEMKKARMTKADFNDLRGLLSVFDKVRETEYGGVGYYKMTLFDGKKRIRHQFTGEIGWTHYNTSRYSCSKWEIGQDCYLTVLRDLIEGVPGLDFPEYGPKGNGQPGLICS